MTFLQQQPLATMLRLRFGNAKTGNRFFCGMICCCLFAAQLAGCSKKGDSNDCDGVAAPTVTATPSVAAGGTINLTATNVTGAEYYLWSGPNNFTSNDQNPVLQNVQSNNAGKYQVRVGITGGCIKTVTTDSVIVTLSAPPCNPAANSGNISGAGSLTFSSVTGAPAGGSYFINASGSNGDLEIEFPGNAKPVAGVYNIQPLGGTWLTGNVRVRFVASNSNWPSSSGKVYVSVSNNKITATACDIPVSAQTYVFATTANMRVTEK